MNSKKINQSHEVKQAHQKFCFSIHKLSKTENNNCNKLKKNKEKEKERTSEEVIPAIAVPLLKSQRITLPSYPAERIIRGS
jgi:hypothetical protein